MDERLRQITTASSVWLFYLDAGLYTRIPRNEMPDHPLPYEEYGKPALFHFAHVFDEWGYPKICVHVDEPNPVHTEIHKRIVSGLILEDNGDRNALMGDFERCPDRLEENPLVSTD